ncbi:MAG: DUF1902 domain-containing protein [Gammaproteobacteria bacterium]|nr:DUF1902 domain-containing protein [Gammaproteobacteria bacterium]MCY4211537.1 DUF1902 domain-containing protein [Gammaproteobacteria bacterium]MCY4283685.1 DUF1902 domain-containing protein [Gammaproteobacteria bacterium]MCY4339144.1 DUF1902 domain-containing protein [Gammaproteobacteria bacterium]
MKRSFMVKAVWDDEANVFYSESDIEGLHIEAVTIAEFEQIMMEVAPDLIVANHLSAPEIAAHPLKDLIPAILWQRPPTEETVVA